MFNFSGEEYGYGKGRSFGDAQQNTRRLLDRRYSISSICDGKNTAGTGASGDRRNTNAERGRRAFFQMAYQIEVSARAFVFVKPQPLLLSFAATDFL